MLKTGLMPICCESINLNENIHNIIIHFCDAGAHSKYFSDYDNRNEQESL